MIMNKTETKRLNELLKTIGDQQYSIDDEGKPLTRFEKLAQMIWDMALGDFKFMDDKKSIEVKYAPDKSFITMIYDRMEGRIPMAASVKNDDSKASVADKVSAQTKSRINDLVN